jgi:hypothetical protein
MKKLCNGDMKCSIRVTITANFLALTGYTNVNFTADHERASSIIFLCLYIL